MIRSAVTPSRATCPVEVVRRGEPGVAADHVAVEAPLEVRVNGQPLAVIMRTPGADADLAVGFLFSEGLIRGAPDVARVDVDDTAGFVNIVFARGRADAVALALDARRHMAINSSCGVCGRRSLDALATDAPALPREWSVPAAVIDRLPEALRSTQPAFAQTGGLHAAGLFLLDGALAAGAEDVGRHSAVDKLVGRMLTAGQLPLSQSLLMVSGRVSFEIVQKAWRAGVPLVAAVSAPTSLAVDLAQRAGMTLLGFVRQGRFNIYAHADRVSPSGEPG